MRMKVDTARLCRVASVALSLLGRIGIWLGANVTPKQHYARPKMTSLRIVLSLYVRGLPIIGEVAF